MTIEESQAQVDAACHKLVESKEFLTNGQVMLMAYSLGQEDEDVCNILADVLFASFTENQLRFVEAAQAFIVEHGQHPVLQKEIFEEM